MVKITLRLNLSDFLNKSHEEEVINKLEEIHKDSITYYLTLWYEEGSISSEDLKRFLVDYESRLHFKTTLKRMILYGMILLIKKMLICLIGLDFNILIIVRNTY